VNSTPPSDVLPPKLEGSKERALDSVLIAEDDPIFRHVLQTWLGKWDYKVVAADNGYEAWKILQQEDSPQMAILDWMMPEMDGLELCRRLRACHLGPYRYVLLVTARDEKQDVVAGLDAGADDYLTKPFNVEELRARLRAGERILGLQDALLRAQKALQFEAAHDRLTGLWSRGAILDRLHSEMQRHHRTGDGLGVMMADLDHFKKINDSHGHLVGDAVLQQTGARLAGAVRSYDLVGRYGGEEFLVVVPGCTDSGLVAGAERLRSCVSAEPMQTSVGPITVTLSLGVVSTETVATHDYETLLRIADHALYAAKAKGRDRVEAASAAPEAASEVEK
jgi:diguanylate cyclase (GGDEF)-like protein